MNKSFWDEVFKLVSEYDAARPKITKELRLYYNKDGTLIGLWEYNHPPGKNYIVLTNPDIFHKTNTNFLRVYNKQLIVLDSLTPSRVRLKKSDKGFKVVKGNAALLLESNETYELIEYYDRADS